MDNTLSKRPSSVVNEEDEEEDVFKPRKRVRKVKKRKSHSEEPPEPTKLMNMKNSSILNTKDVEQRQSTSLEVTEKREDIDVDHCPICQVPFGLLKISAETHTANCYIGDNVQECPLGSKCENDNIFHFRDYSHCQLAAFRDRDDYQCNRTPQKQFKTPRKRSTGKKKSQVSPAANSSKIPTSLLEKHTEGGRKKLHFEQNQSNLSIASASTSTIPDTNVCNIASEAVKEELPFWPNQIIKMEQIEDDVPIHSEIEVKEEANFESQNAINCASYDVSSGHQLQAELTLNYDFTSNTADQVVINNRVPCSEGCNVAVTDSLQAFCSFTIRSSGVNAATATDLSPVTLNLTMDNSGWGALSVEGRASAFVQDVNASVCECSKFASVSCTIKDTKERLCNENQVEKIAFTFKDPPLNDGTSFSKSYHQVSISTSKNVPSGNQKLTSRVKSGAETLSEAFDNDSCTPACEDLPRPPSPSDCSRPVSPSTCEAPTSFRRSDFNGSSRPTSPATTLQKSSAGTSRPSTPLPFPVVASKSSSSSWTLHPAPRKSSVTSSLKPQSSVSGGRKVPAYKKIPGTQIVVDAFNYGVIPGVKAYFLSHFHSDHYTGLRKGFMKPIFCSQVTANLVHLKLGVANEYLHVLKFGEPRLVLGVEVEIFDANHCPGAVMFLFRLIDGRRYLHVGDFRAHENMEQFLQLQFVDTLYLDTTYCDPSYDFPSQEEVIEKVIETVQSHLRKNIPILFVCGTYTIGKEKVFKSIAKHFGWRIWAPPDKVKVLRCLEDNIVLSSLTTDPFQAQVHVLSMKDIAVEALENYFKKYSPKYKHIVGFKPTGWTTSTSLKSKVSDFQKISRERVTIYGVPYSEHSSFSELRRFVRFVRPKDIQVTVNVTKATQFKKMFQQWLANSNDNNGQSSMLQFVSCQKP